MIKEKEMKCSECGGTIKDDFIRMKYEVNNSRITIKNVPAKVCIKCGVELVEGHTAKDLDLLVTRVSEDVDRFAKSLALPPKRHNISLAV